VNTHATGPKYTKKRRAEMKKLIPAPLVYPCMLCKRREAEVWLNRPGTFGGEAYCNQCLDTIRDA